MTVTFTYVPSTSLGKTRSFIQDTNVAALLDRAVTSHNGKTLTFSGAAFTENELIGYGIYPNTASAISYQITSNTASTVTILGDIANSVPASGTSAMVNLAMFCDTEITNFLAQGGGDVLMAAAVGLRTVASNQALLAKRFRKQGIEGLELEKRGLDQIIKLAESFEKRSVSRPASVVNSFELGQGLRTDDFEVDDYNEFGQDLSEYSKT